MVTEKVNAQFNCNRLGERKMLRKIVAGIISTLSIIAVLYMSFGTTSFGRNALNSITLAPSSLPASLTLLGAGAKWAAGNGTSALYVNWKDNWESHHLTDGRTWGPWPTELEMDKWRISVSDALKESGFDVKFAGDIPEDLSGYDVIVLSAYWAVEPKNEPLIRQYISNGGGVVLLSGVPEYFRCYCKDWWTYRCPRDNSSVSVEEWFGSQWYVNTGGYANVTVDNPFGTAFMTGDTLIDGCGYSNAAVEMLYNDTQVVAGWGTGPVFAYTHEYGQGRVYYQAAFVSVPLVAVQDISITPQRPNYNEDVAVSAIIKDHVEVDQALLSFTYDNVWQNVSMRKYGDNFNATIPAQPYNTSVQYRIYALDANGRWVASQIYSYAMPDVVPPEIVSIDWEPKQPSSNDTVTVSANITEPSEASGVKAALFSYKDSFGQWWNTTMTYDSGSGLWRVIIPEQPHNSTVDFYVIAYDNAGNTAVADNSGTYYAYNVLAEFASLVIVPVFMATTLSAIILYRKRRLK